MASGFFAILDDIATLMDDVAVTSKIAASKTAGILGDDLAVNAEKATGFVASRELPVLWAITKGSFLNKLILLPIIFLLNFFLPVAITYILIIGGFYLAYEGVEKIVEFLFHRSKETVPVAQAEPDPVKAEKAKIKSAVTTDFILSLEIVIISLSTVLDKALPLQLVTVSIIAVLATIGVYGIVALIVRMDDAGYKLIAAHKNSGVLSALGRFLVKLLPLAIKFLGVVGTIALLTVAGGIFAHNIAFIHQLLPSLPSIIKDFLLGLVGGTVGVLLMTVVKWIGSMFSKK